MHYIGIESPGSMAKPVTIREIMEHNEKQLKLIEEKNKVGKADNSEQNPASDSMSIKKITAKKERLKKRFADRIESATTNERKAREEKKRDDKILDELRKSSSFNHTHYVKALYPEKPMAEPN